MILEPSHPRILSKDVDLAVQYSLLSATSPLIGQQSAVQAKGMGLYILNRPLQ